MPIKISSQFDAGAIEVVSVAQADQIQLNLRKDSHADFMQWFYFRLQGARDQACTIQILNAGESTYAAGWENYRAVASYDREQWFRVDTSFDGNVMTIHHIPAEDSMYFAYFEPYSWERHLALIGRAAYSSQVRVEDLGNTVDGRDLNLLVVGDEAAKHKIWVIARQHPGESMAEWLVEGLLDALLDENNAVSRKILEQAVFYIVPNMNPDGSVRGNLRTNAAGANLNREWMTPSLTRSPEVFHVRNRIYQTGCDLFLDVHGDEALPYNFVAGSEMLQDFTAAQLAEQNAFVADFVAATPDFQSVVGYPPDKYSDEMLTMASKHIGNHFKCVSLTLEMPFKDNVEMPDPVVGWNGDRSAKLGESILLPILQHLKRKA